MWRQAQISRALTRNKSSTRVTLLWHFRTSYPSEPMETQHVPASTALGSSVTLFPALLKIRNEDLERFTGTWCAEDHGRRERERLLKKNMSSFGCGSTRPFDDDGYTGYDPRLASKQFDSFSNFDADSVDDSSPIFSNQPYLAGDNAFSSHPVPRTQSLPSMFSKGGPSLPSPAEMEPDEGFPLKEWWRRNVLELEEKEKKEKEKLQRIIEEAEAYKVEFYRKRQLSVEKKKASNRESEKVFVENQEKFQAEAEKNYWKAIAELIPREVAAIEKRGKKRDKDKEKKASVVVVQGSKPGKPTDLTRMRQILVKLNYNPPQHMKPKPEPTAQPKQDAKAIVINEAAVAAV